MPTATGHTTAIRATKVVGADVCDAAGVKIGRVEDVVLDKASSRIMFAVLSVGGAVTTSDNVYPLPWSQLDYDAERGGYVVSCTQQQLASGPSASLSKLTENDAAASRSATYDHFKVAKDW